jgi:hypothetical protein
MNILKKLAVVFGRLWAPALLLTIVLASGYIVQATADMSEVRAALGVALAFGPVT